MTLPVSPTPASYAPLNLGACLKTAARIGVLGAAAGLLVGAAGQSIVAHFVAGTDSAGPTWLQRLLGVTITASLLGALLFVVAAIALVLTRRARRTSRRWAAIVPITLLSTLVLALHAVGVTLHVLLGSHLTSSGLAFFLNSKGHIAGAVGAQYLGYLVPLIVLCVAAAAGLAWLARRALEIDPSRVRTAEVAGCLCMTGLAGFAAAAPARTPMGPGIARTSPEVALFASVSADDVPGPLLMESNVLIREALDSPPRSQLESWNQVARGVAPRANVIVITLESVAVSHIGYLGYPRSVTPNLDRIAEKSLRMTHAYTTATHSNYAQMAVISSLFPRRGTTLDMYQRLDYPRVLLHDLGHGLGYETGTISSQDETWQGMKRFQDTGTPTYFRHAPDHQGDHLDLVTEDVAPDDATIDHAIGWVGQKKGGPFSLYINLQSTHFPYPIPAAAPHPFQPHEPKGTFNYVRWDQDDKPVILNKYDNALHYVDAQVGRLYDALAAHGILDDTILVVTSDHGELFFEHELVTHGRTLLEGEARVPLLVHYPAALDPGDDPTPVSTLDVLPTVVDLLGLPPHPAYQGESFAHLREDGPASKQSAVYLNIQGWKHHDGIVCPPYKLIYDPDTQGSELYDVIRDPGEKLDLAPSKPEVLSVLKGALRAQMDAQGIYHANTDTGARLRAERFAPRMLSCPVLPR